MALSASASSWLGTATRTIWQPEAVSSAICWRVALISEVSVVHMDCTLTGASPPTRTLPTLSCLLFRRGERTGGGAVGIPRSTMALFCLRSEIEVDWIKDIGGKEHQRESC